MPARVVVMSESQSRHAMRLRGASAHYFPGGLARIFPSRTCFAPELFRAKVVSCQDYFKAKLFQVPHRGDVSRFFWRTWPCR